MSVAVATSSSTPTTPESSPLGPLNDQQESANSKADNNKEMSPNDKPSDHHDVIDFTHQDTVEKILTMTSVDHSFKMKDQDLQALRKLPGNAKCIDCGEADPIWASVNLGIFVCLSCSGKHRALGTHVSFVRSIQMDSWSDAQLKKMYTGGNDNCAEFLNKHGVTETSASVEKYDTPAAHLYQKVLFARVRGETEPTELPNLSKKQPRERRSLKMEGFGSAPHPTDQQKGLFQRLRTMSMNDDALPPSVRGSASSAPSSGNIGELKNKPLSITQSKSMEDFCDVDITERTASGNNDGDQYPIEVGENKEEEEEQEDAFNIDDLMNEIEGDMGFMKSRWSDAAKESKTKDMNPPEQDPNNNDDGILRRISRSSWFGGGQAAKGGQNPADKMEEEIEKNEHDDIMSILEDDTVATVATSQSPSAPKVSPVGKDAADDDEVMPSPPGGFFRKVSRTISGPRVRRDTRKADEALDKFMDGL